MQRTLLVASVLLLAVSGSAFAQTASDVPGYPGVKVLPVVNPPATPAVTTSLQQQLSGNLIKAGFTDVKIMPEAFIIQAKNKAGDPVTMFFSPDSLTVFTAQDAKGQDSQASTAGTPAPVAPK